MIAASLRDLFHARAQKMAGMFVGRAAGRRHGRKPVFSGDRR